MICFRQHAHVVIATIQFMKCVALFTAPALVNAVVDDDSNKMQWAVVFLCCGIVMIIANLLSFPVFTDQPAPWTTSKPKPIEDKVEMNEFEIIYGKIMTGPSQSTIHVQQNLPKL
ncbi:hypothetical protein ANCCEY_02481 [Ancylostoma ceylanicum]|uniref:Major facilitator superfamily (MFS) profile domain-containing protein n=1 Tax=Ancylostoma ceylanicum TaxID=53326 RepID=A0A0D6M2G4_9BILA|nr:hypothetical protein ANCCEY_02481 [Ancylostoma ceylanicum]